MGKSKKNGTNFLVQGSILAVASIISRIIGLVYRIPMNSILGDIGNGYYSCAFDIYNVILIISSYSLPLAVSKTVSAKVAKGQFNTAYQLLKSRDIFALESAVSQIMEYTRENSMNTHAVPNYIIENTIQYIRLENTWTRTSCSCSSWSITRVLSGTGNHDAKCYFTDH